MSLKANWLCRSNILSVFFYLASWPINPPEANSLKSTSKFLVFAQKKVGRTINFFFIEQLVQ